MNRREWLFSSAGMAAAWTRTAKAGLGQNPPAPVCETTGNLPAKWFLQPGVFPNKVLQDVVDNLGIEAGLPQTHPMASGVLARPSIYDLDSAAKKNLSDAYKAMSTGLAPGDTPDGKKSSTLRPCLGVQATIHDRYCSDNAHGVHDAKGGLFFAWHRAFLFYHERLIQWVLKNRCGVDEPTANSFRLPYWNPQDWTQQAGFGVYGDPQLKELYRDRGPSNSSPPSQTTSFGTETDPEKVGDLVLQWHADVHRWLCGDFTPPMTSGFDPLFYAFHAYVDMLCEATHAKGHIKLDAGGKKWWAVLYDVTADNNVDTTSDPPPGWVQVDLNEFNDPAKLGYSYVKRVPFESFPADTPALDFVDISLPKSPDAKYQLVVRPKNSRQDGTVLTDIRPFGHQSMHHFVRVPLSKAGITPDQAKQYLTDAWEFAVVIPGAQNGGAGGRGGPSAGQVVLTKKPQLVQ
jgi:hypothetical protein